MSAPNSRKRSTRSSCRVMAAQCRGLLPRASAALHQVRFRRQERLDPLPVAVANRRAQRLEGLGRTPKRAARALPQQAAVDLVGGCAHRRRPAACPRSCRCSATRPRSAPAPPAAAPPRRHVPPRTAMWRGNWYQYWALTRFGSRPRRLRAPVQVARGAGAETGPRRRGRPRARPRTRSVSVSMADGTGEAGLAQGEGAVRRPAGGIRLRDIR